MRLVLPGTQIYLCISYESYVATEALNPLYSELNASRFIVSESTRSFTSLNKYNLKIENYKMDRVFISKKDRNQFRQEYAKLVNECRENPPQDLVSNYNNDEINNLQQDCMQEEDLNESFWDDESSIGTEINEDDISDFEVINFNLLQSNHKLKYTSGGTFLILFYI